MPQLGSIKKLRRRHIYLLLLLLVMVTASVGIYTASYLLVKHITVVGTDSPLRGVESWNKKLLPFVSEEEVKHTLISSNPRVKSVAVHKQYPSTLYINVSLYPRTAYFKVDSGYFLLAEDGRILEKTTATPQDLTIIHYYQKLNYISWQSGDMIQYKDVLTALYFLGAVSDLGLRVDSIDINGTNMIALQLQGRKILFTTEKDQQLQDYQLKEIIRQFKVQGKEFAVLDLRFDKPVIQFK